MALHKYLEKINVEGNEGIRLQIEHRAFEWRQPTNCPNSVGHRIPAVDVSLKSTFRPRIGLQPENERQCSFPESTP
jgi:hypothetical protein